MRIHSILLECLPGKTIWKNESICRSAYFLFPPLRFQKSHYLKWTFSQSLIFFVFLFSQLWPRFHLSKSTNVLPKKYHARHTYSVRPSFRLSLLFRGYPNIPHPEQDQDQQWLWQGPQWVSEWVSEPSSIIDKHIYGICLIISPNVSTYTYFMWKP